MQRTYSAMCPNRECKLKPLSVSMISVLAPTGLADGSHLILTQTICERCTTLLASQIMGQVANVDGKWVMMVPGPDGRPMVPPESGAGDPAADLGKKKSGMWTPGN